MGGDIAHSNNELQTSAMDTVRELKNCHNIWQKSGKFDMNKEKVVYIVWSEYQGTFFYVHTFSYNKFCYWI